AWLGRAAAGLFAALQAAHWLPGAAPVPADAGDGPLLRLVQPDIPQSLKWDPRARQDHLRLTADLSYAPGYERIDHLIWPETATLFPLAGDPAFRLDLARLVPPAGYLLTGSTRVERAPVLRAWNSLHALDANGEIRATYDKFHLVPFGEYVPLRGILPLERITVGPVDFSSGPGPRTIRLPGLPAFSPLICYESIFPRAVRHPVDRPDWILLATNDAWFGSSAGPYQHYAASRFRAIEEGLPVVRAANGGISAVIDGEGRVRAALALGARTHLDARLPRALPPPPYARAGDALLAALALALLLAGCADTAYLLQSAGGHLRLLQAARPVSDWLADPQTPPALRQQLELAQRLRAFAVAELALPDNASYRRHAELGRSAVVWNVVAAPEFSLALQTWCFPVTGCVGYRGYFAEDAAHRQAALLRAQGLEVSVYGVPAYSTLGWLNWAGGDPLLSTFIHYPEGELARLLFHELAHQVLYVPDDTRFNESFASAVEGLGARQWLQRHGSAAARREDAERQARRADFRALTQATRRRLAELYEQKGPPALDPSALRAMKNEVMRDFRADHARLRAGWGAYPGYDAWVAQANNAALGAQAAYDDLVPAFEALFERQGRDWRRFYDAVRRLADLPAPARLDALTRPLPEHTRG
ncbi:MAG: apolipoprotein N-acyltransferase, partial [Rhodoferax sp.]|nr:apolipoprotein N-acyltransferase [Rhodoferax sp.]